MELKTIFNFIYITFSTGTYKIELHCIRIFQKNNVYYVQQTNRQILTPIFHFLYLLDVYKYNIMYIYIYIFFLKSIRLCGNRYGFLAIIFFSNKTYLHNFFYRHWLRHLREHMLVICVPMNIFCRRS